MNSASIYIPTCLRSGRNLRLCLAGLLAGVALLAGCGGNGTEAPYINPPPVVVPPADSETPMAEVTGPGELKSATLMTTLSLPAIQEAIDAGSGKGLIADPKYAVQAWRLTYLTTDGYGNPCLLYTSPSPRD